MLWPIASAALREHDDPQNSDINPIQLDREPHVSRTKMGI
jgi:hypothetical protein